MNCSNCTTSTTSTTTIYVTLVGPALSLTIAIIGILANTFLVIVVSNDKKMKTPCFTLILGGSIGSMTMVSGYTLSCLGRLGAYPYSNRPRIYCQLVSGYLLKLVSVPFYSQVGFLIAIDRLLCSVWPIKYRQRGKRVALIGLLVCTIYGLGELIFLLSWQSPYDNVASCASTSAVNGALFSQLFSNSNLCFCTLCVIGYTIMMISLCRNRVENDGADLGFNSIAERKLFMKQQKAVLPATKLLLALYLIFGVGPEILFIVMSNLGMSGGIGTIVAEQIKVTSSLIEIVSLSLRSRQFRQGVRALIGQAMPSKENTASNVIRVQQSTL